MAADRSDGPLNYFLLVLVIALVVAGDFRYRTQEARERVLTTERDTARAECRQAIERAIERTDYATIEVTRKIWREEFPSCYK
jgi:hypothetical protein